jgi:ankyrin repeat protein
MPRRQPGRPSARAEWPETAGAGADVNQRFACEGIVEGLQVLLDAGADPEAVTAMSRTALHLVAASSDRPVEAATLLLDKGAPADAADAQGETPLMLAADRGSAVVELLLAQGARVDARDPVVGAMPLT